MKYIALILILFSFEAYAAETECHPYVPVESQGNADLLAMRGVTCFEEGKYLQALLFYRQAYAITQSPLLEGGIGRCLQELGFPDLARQYFLSYLEAAPAGTEAHDKIQQRLQVVEETLSSSAVEVTVSSTPADARVYLVLEDEYWEEIGATPLKFKLLPGNYRMILRRPDFQTEEVELDINADPTLSEHSLKPQDQAIHTEMKWRKAGVITMISSTPFIAGSAALITLGQLSDDPDKESLYQTLGIASGALGLSAMMTGVVLYLVGSSPDDSTTSIHLTPSSVGWSYSW